ncbi:hypothetical protein DR64_1551 [Paraburkholderia xenovorans LB400]|jgi:hypothetical protein|uniref:Uncharacterized protein n=1 Tax=Paraburkholderia xenovorans (strain LB400) TaxID=266265 RepID=Q144W7_PARXL|nr:hypothetical protein [Paraburkholderia xenovorans]ABE29122.1 hypothetical protein Bxe_A3876 [Paraburkholderia xenovorans LB400]AIP30559.1 hypothetical protein DR64_1551 [Paraburkholderia xenovorans LB400]
MSIGSIDSIGSARAVLPASPGVCLVLKGNTISRNYYANQAQPYLKSGNGIRLFAEPDFSDILRERIRGREMFSAASQWTECGFISAAMAIMMPATGTLWPKIRDVVLRDMPFWMNTRRAAAGLLMRSC